MLRVGIANESLLMLYKKYQTSNGTFITAYNPFGKENSEAAYAANQAELKMDLSKRNLTIFDGVGKHPYGNWPAEPSFFVLGLSLEAAKRLGKKYNQNAIVWCGADAIPELLLLR